MNWCHRPRYILIPRWVRSRLMLLPVSQLDSIRVEGGYWKVALAGVGSKGLSEFKVFTYFLLYVYSILPG